MFPYLPTHYYQELSDVIQGQGFYPNYTSDPLDKSKIMIGVTYLKI